jgi:hypothetical protein
VSRVLVPSPLSGLSDPRSDQPTVRRTTTGPPDRGVGPESRRRVLRVVAIVCFVGMVALLVAAVVVLVR